MSKNDEIDSILECIPENISKKIESLDEIEEGIEQTYLIKLNNSRKLVIKRHKTDWYKSNRGFLAGPNLIKKIKNEYRDYPLPKIVKVSEELEYPFYIMEYVENEEYSISDLKKEEQKKFAENLGKYMAYLHNIETCEDKYGYMGFSNGKLHIIDGYDTSQELASKTIQKWSKDLEKKGGYTKDDKEVKNRRFDDILNKIKSTPEKIMKNKEDFNSKINSFCHTDLREDNILRKDNDIKAIIDWALPVIHDPIFNITRTEEKLFFGPNRKNRKNLSKHFRVSYFKNRKTNIEFNSKNLKNRLDLYRLYTAVVGMRNFPEWFKHHSNKRKKKQERYYRELFLSKYEELFL